MGSLTILLFGFCLISVSMTSIAAVDTITLNQTISDGDTIRSSRESFEMGFFSPGNSTRRYFGIWYCKMARGKVVWVANREIPITDKSGVFTIEERGILTVYGQNNSAIWSSHTSRQPRNPVAQLLDSGNLVVRNENDSNRDNFFWQSFHHPGNTFLPGMKVGRIAPGLDVYISAWKSNDDPSESIHTFEIDTKGLELDVKRKKVLRSRSGPWNGIGFSGLPYIRPDSIHDYDFVYNGHEVYFTYNLINISIYAPLVLHPNGVMDRIRWIDQINHWNICWSMPVDTCDNWANCGVYGSCTAENSLCECLDRFVPNNEEEWQEADWSSGCVRRVPLDCQNGDGFIKYPNVKLPDTNNSRRNDSMTVEECRTTCLNDCSCMAYTPSIINGNGSGCLLWFGDLIDIKRNTTDGQDLFIRMAASEVGFRKTNHWRLIIAIAIPTTVAIFIIVICFTKGSKAMRSLWLKNAKHNEKIEVFMASYRSHITKRYSYSDIKKMTNSFINKLGQGGFGGVYKGKLPDGRLVAVKLLNKSKTDDGQDFINEVASISRTSHINIVTLLGFCYEGTNRALIYEYMPNGSLDRFIYSQGSPHTNHHLEWKALYEIAIGIARGLEYLHRGCNTRIVHFDIKPHNMLLNEDFCPKIADFGLAKLCKREESKVSMIGARGTIGYMAPEVFCRNFGRVSYKSDVYSYGMMVLEIVGGRKNIHVGVSHTSEIYFPDWIYKHLESGEVSTLLGDIKEEEEEMVKKMILVGLWCIQTNPSDRPSMTNVVEMLEGRLQSLQIPPKPFLSSPTRSPPEQSSTASSPTCESSQMEEQ